VTDDQITIESGATSTGNAACYLRWPGGGVLLHPPVVLATARDLHAAATRAETDIALIAVLRDRVGMDMQEIAAMLRDVRTARPLPAAKVALRIEAVAGAGTGRPYVHIARGSMKASLSPDSAREMAGHWIEAAVAAQIDARLRYVLGEYDQISGDDVDNIFAGMRRAAGTDPTEGTP
jgi:hypothetical protein